LTSVKDIYSFLDKIAPFETQTDFDNSGFLIGDFEQKIKKVMIVLDITKSVVYEAKKVGAELIISHHPAIFGEIKNLFCDTVPFLLAKFGISVICAHTNLDLAENGVNTCLAKKAGLKSIAPLALHKNLPLGFFGEIEETNAHKFASFLKSSLNCGTVRFTDFGKKIKKTAISSGAGGNLVKNAVFHKCDAFVTGEIKHHEILEANDAELCIFDVGHFGSENIIINYLIKILRLEFKNVEFIKSFSSKCEWICI
jgi:dinuclear metal center YbgI/SA1388 family protein